MRSRLTDLREVVSRAPHTRLTVSALSVGLVGAAGCALILGIDDKPLLQADAGPPPPDPCQHVVPPPRTGADDDPTRPSAQYVTAAKTFDLLPDDAGTLGFDLDGTCACFRGSAHDGGQSCTNAQASKGDPLCDPDGGIDNALSSLQAIQLATSFGPLQNADAKCGRSNVLVVIGGYNGRANDPQVTFSPILSDGLDEPHETGESPSDCNGPGLRTVYTPRWDGTDKWSTDDRFVSFHQTSPKPALIISGYVRDWTLVADDISGSEFVVPFGPLVLRANQLTIVAELEPLDDSGNVLPPDTSTPAAKIRVKRGQFTGRVTSRSVLSAVSGVPLRLGTGTGGATSYLCPGDSNYKLINNDLCQHLDLVADSTKDFSGAPCDAISAAARFTAEPAIMKEAEAAPDASVTPCALPPDTVCPPP
jgi:hypothetical protein